MHRWSCSIRDSTIAARWTRSLTIQVKLDGIGQGRLRFVSRSTTTPFTNFNREGNFRLRGNRRICRSLDAWHWVFTKEKKNSNLPLFQDWPHAIFCSAYEFGCGSITSSYTACNDRVTWMLFKNYLFFRAESTSVVQSCIIIGVITIFPWSIFQKTSIYLSLVDDA